MFFFVVVVVVDSNEKSVLHFNQSIDFNRLIFTHTHTQSIHNHQVNPVFLQEKKDRFFIPLDMIINDWSNLNNFFVFVFVSNFKFIHLMYFNE